MEEEIPIGHITNGVHVPSWLAWQMQQLYDRNFPVDWFKHLAEADAWQGIHLVDPGELWETHYALKNLLLAFVRRRVSRQCRRRGEATRWSKPHATCSIRTCSPSALHGGLPPISGPTCS